MALWSAWVEAERGRFFLLLPVAMAAAILGYFALPAEPEPWLGLLFVAGAGAVLAAGWRRMDTRFAALLLLAAAAGFWRAEQQTAAMPPLLDLPRGAVVVTGTVAAVDILASGRRVTVADPAADGVALTRDIRVKLAADDATAVAPGDIVSVRALLFRPDRPAYPGGWDSGRDAFFEHLGASGFALGGVTVVRPAAGRGLAVRVRAMREAIARNILAVLPVATGSIAVTLLTGFQQDIPPQEHQAFISAGLAHLLAVAGLHVGIVMGLFFGAVRFALSRWERPALHWPVKSIAACAALAAGAGYAALTGAHLPILRSLAMASLVTVGVVAGRRAISLRGLAIAAMVIMLTTPEAVIGVSFQMSFSAVLALISGYAAARGLFARLHERNGRGGGAVLHMAGLFYTSLLAGAASMPFAAFQFQQMQPYWILANLVAVPVTAFWVLPLGLAALALMPVHAAALALVPMGWGIAVIVAAADGIAAWPDAMLQVAPMPAAGILLYAAGLVWLCVWRSRIRFFGLALMAASLGIYAGARVPDALVSPDAKLIAVRTASGFVVLRQKKASGFVLAQWRPISGGTPFTPVDPDVCAQGACRFGGIAVVADAGACPVAAAVVLSPAPLRHACDGAACVVIDRFTVWRDGAAAVWLGRGGAVRVLTDREVQGARPWVPAWPDW